MTDVKVDSIFKRVVSSEVDLTQIAGDEQLLKTVEHGWNRKKKKLKRI